MMHVPQVNDLPIKSNLNWIKKLKAKNVLGVNFEGRHNLSYLMSVSRVNVNKT